MLSKNRDAQEVLCCLNKLKKEQASLWSHPCPSFLIHFHSQLEHTRALTIRLDGRTNRQAGTRDKHQRRHIDNKGGSKGPGERGASESSEMKPPDFPYKIVIKKCPRGFTEIPHVKLACLQVFFLDQVGMWYIVYRSVGSAGWQRCLLEACTGGHATCNTSLLRSKIHAR